MEQAQSLITFKRPYLSSGQKAVYAAVCQRLEANRPILFEEAKRLYIESGCRNVRGGKIFKYNFFAKRIEDKTEKYGARWEGEYQPMEDWEIKRRVTFWFMTALGALVIKGFLKVLPAIDLRQIE